MMTLSVGTSGEGEVLRRFESCCPLLGEGFSIMRDTTARTVGEMRVGA